MTLTLAEVTLAATSDEIAAGSLDPAKAARLASLVHDHGFAVLHGEVVPKPVLAALATRLEFDAAYRWLTKMGPLATADGTARHGHGSARLPRSAPFVQPDWAANPIVEQCAAAILGPRPYLNMLGGNTNYPGSGSQDLHMDGCWQYPEAIEQPCYMITVQVAPLGATELNGATEIWPHTHKLVDFASADKRTDEVATDARLKTGTDARRATDPPLQLCVPPGAVAFRDSRCWHRGVPNRSDWPRTILGLQYAAASASDDLVRNGTHLRSRHGTVLGPSARVPGGYEINLSQPNPPLFFSRDCQHVFAEPSPFGVQRPVEFVDHTIDWEGNENALPMRLPGLPLPNLPLSEESNADVEGSAGQAQPAWLRTTCARFADGFCLASETRALL
jgi:ectoine hydroxylase-related dioxygenase (phytanoyl-CoA dioxygenase family)